MRREKTCEIVRNGYCGVVVYGEELYAAKNSKTVNNRYAGNGRMAAQEKISAERFIVME